VKALVSKAFLITGARRTGKTSLARAVVGKLRDRGLTVAGVLQEAIEQDGERVAYEAVRLAKPDERVVVARRGAPSAGEEPICSFSFSDAGFAAARDWIASDRADVIVIDEVSKAESRGRGHAVAIDRALQGEGVVILCVRADELVHVMERFGIEEPIAALDTGAREGIEGFVDAIATARC
jgi:nucleoside-triphosphatase THEP1